MASSITVPIVPQGPQVALSPERIQELREVSKSNLYVFAKGILGYEWFTPEIHLPICLELQNEDNHELLVVLPRGWQKSTLCSICYPIWRAIRNPNIRILLVQNTATNADAKLNVIKAIFEGHTLFRQLFPELLPTGESIWRTGKLQLPRDMVYPEGTFESIGMGGSVIGRHYDETIEDDTVAPDADDMDERYATPKKDDIAKAKGFHNSLSSIVDNLNVRNSLVVGTRWAEDDLISHIEKTMGSSVKVIKRACKENEKGEPDERGKVTYPNRFPQEVLDKLARRWGPYMFSCLYLNLPIRSDDMIFKPEWIRRFVTEPFGLQVNTTIDSASDPQNLQSGDPDYCVVLTTGKDPTTGRIYLLEYSRERCNPGRHIDLIFQQVERWKPLEVGIPSVAYEQSLKYWLEEEMRRRGVFFSIKLIKYGSRSKELRIQGLQPVFSSGSIFVRDHHEEIVSELLKFPLGAHDDLIDTLASQLDLWNLTIGPSNKAPIEDEGPMSFARGARELRARRSLEKDELYGDLLQTSPGELGRRILDMNFFGLN